VWSHLQCKEKFCIRGGVHDLFDRFGIHVVAEPILLEIPNQTVRFESIFPPLGIEVLQRCTINTVTALILWPIGVSIAPEAEFRVEDRRLRRILPV
jgi:hypothetical protein